MKVLDNFIISEVAPCLTHRVLWINPKDSTLKYYENSEWKLCTVNINNSQDGSGGTDQFPINITLDLLHGYYKQYWDDTQGETNIFINKKSDTEADMDKTLFDTSSYSVFKVLFDMDANHLILQNTQNQSLAVVGMVSNTEIKFSIYSNGQGGDIRLVSEPIIGSISTKVLTLNKI